MHELLEYIIPYATQAFELIGVLIIITGSTIAIYKLIVCKFNLDNISIKLQLAKSLELGLEFKLAAEILRTVLIQTTHELLILSSIVILRVVMTFVIHWEIRTTEKKAEKQKNES